MSEFLLFVFYFSRPITTLSIQANILGLSFFEFIAIIFSLVISGILFFTLISQKKVSLSRIEISLLLFVFWCLAISAIYFYDANYKLLAKWVLPPITYLAVRRTIKTKRRFLPHLKYMLIGCGIAAIVNSIYVGLGHGLETESYWTGLLRYKGLYEGSHTMGHSMGLLLILIGIYKALSNPKTGLLQRKPSIFMDVLLIIFAIAAAYGLYKSQVRTVFVGLSVFFSVWLFLYNKKLFFIFAGLACAGIVAMLPFFSLLFFDFINAAQGDSKAISMAGSGRPDIWAHNLEIFKNLSVDRKLAGVGIGNIMMSLTEGGSLDTTKKSMVWNSHNDFLEVLMETGIFGFILILVIYAQIYKKIKTLPPLQKSVYLAFFLGIVAMNLSSNSYISRFAFAQMFFMILVFIELADNQPKTVNQNLIRRKNL